ncbi:MAG: type II toxin-antitoxin system RelE/ParE family toxin [Candidatus Scalindua sp.]|nr:type II toxin-antitoxin system RelE/ParE family toxin [Candidatus Scalindua sp.]MDR4503317.1 type II toxin-antitoxin system RelE/ParE family toxin [Candidatus Scalindua sp.]
MVKVTWTDQALDDLDSICLFIARDSFQYAKLFAIRIFEATDRLEIFPKSGRVVPEIGRKDICEIIVGNYRIIYRIITKEVEILTIHHGARPFDNINLPVKEP